MSSQSAVEAGRFDVAQRNELLGTRQRAEPLRSCHRQQQRTVRRVFRAKSAQFYKISAVFQ